jgi:uncharacterized protein YprB with RNaseH-like and TPR domain
MNTAKIQSVEYLKEHGAGLRKVHYHNVTFEGDSTKYNIGTKEQEPRFLKPGQSLTYEIVDGNRIKRVDSNQMQNKTVFRKAAPKVEVSPKSAPAQEPVSESTSLIRKLNDYKESDILFFDIETARITKNLKKGSPLEAAWLYKCRYDNELNRKTGKEFTPEEYFIDKAALYAPFAKVVAIVVGKIVKDKLVTKKYSGEESEMLAGFNTDIETALSKNSNTVFGGWANIGFDQPFLAQRMLVSGIRPNLLLDNAHLKPWEVKSLDLKEIWKGTAFHPASLISVAVALGLPSPKNNMDGSEVGEAYYEGKIEEIVDYCEGDVLTTANIYRKFMGKDLISLK